MNNMKSRGPSIDPWGTPYLTGNSFDTEELIFTHCFFQKGMIETSQQHYYLNYIS